jgi:hypothetical protein
MSKIIEIGSDEDGEAYYVVGDVTLLGAKRALNKQLKEWGIEEDMEYHTLEWEKSNFWYTEGGDHDGWTWWAEPDKAQHSYEKIKPIGVGWLATIV